MEGRGTLLIYLAAALVYVVIGVLATEFMLTSLVAVAYLLVAVWLLPALVRRVSRR